MKSNHLCKGAGRLVSIGIVATIMAQLWGRAVELPPGGGVVEPPTTNTAIVPMVWLEKDSYNWDERHAQVLEIQKSLDPEIVLIGDSITHFWGGVPSARHQNGTKAWADTFDHHRVLNMGFGWDRTQNVLWRLDHGEMDGTHPKVVVLNIGTNNFSKTRHARDNTPAEVAQAIEAIVDRICRKCPSSRIIVMGVFPRGFNVDNPYRAKITALNHILAVQLAGRPSVGFLDISSGFLTKDGMISPAILFDGTHPTEAGYAIWGKALLATGILR
jgi:lysophospholipase L1-like esterase